MRFFSLRFHLFLFVIFPTGFINSHLPLFYWDVNCEYVFIYFSLFSYVMCICVCVSFFLIHLFSCDFTKFFLHVIFKQNSFIFTFDFSSHMTNLFSHETWGFSCDSFIFMLFTCVYVNSLVQFLGIKWWMFICFSHLITYYSPLKCMLFFP